MLKRCTMVLFVVGSLMATSSTGWAVKAYVTDSFRISLRRGPSIENKILRFIPSGLPVVVNETTPDGWSRVRLLEDDQGILEGWVLSRYLVKRLPWEEQAKALQGENARLKQRLAHIDKKWETTIQQEKGLSKELKESNKAVKEKSQRLSEENEILKSSQRNKWFTTGGLVMFSGLLVGLLVGKQPQKRRLSF